MLVTRIQTILLILLVLLLIACSNTSSSTETDDQSPASTLTPELAITEDMTATPITSDETVSLEPTATPILPTPWPTAASPLTYEQRGLLFDELWSIVNERYIDPDFNGVDWALEKQLRREPVLNAPDDETYYQELKEMVWVLNDDHSGFMTPQEVLELESVIDNEVEYSGFGLYTLRLESGSALVLQVHEGSPAEAAGIQACDQIYSIDGLYFQYEDEEGEPGSTATFEFERPNEEPFTRTLQRAEMIKVIDIPAQLLPNTSQRIGYIRLDLDILWSFDSPPQFFEKLVGLQADGPLDGLIIDLRTNQGGWRDVLQSIAGIFVEDTLGEFYGRSQNDPFVAPPSYDPPPAYPELPLALLVSQYTKSYGEILAATLQAERDAIIIGQPTAANLESVYPYDLPFNSRVWIAEQGFRLNDGKILDDIGATPDILDETEWANYPCGEDPQIQRAVELLEQR